MALFEYVIEVQIESEVTVNVKPTMETLYTKQSSRKLRRCLRNTGKDSLRNGKQRTLPTTTAVDIDREQSETS